MKTHKDLDVWKLAIKFTTDVYRATADFPKSEIYGLASQLRRAAVSVASNVAEGATRQGTKEFVQFLYFAFGSASEIETQLIISHNLHYLADDVCGNLSSVQTQLSRMMSGLIKSLKQK